MRASVQVPVRHLQLYTALSMRGRVLWGRLRDGLAARLKADGYASLVDAWGVDA